MHACTSDHCERVATDSTHTHTHTNPERERKKKWECERRRCIPAVGPAARQRRVVRSDLIWRHHRFVWCPHHRTYSRYLRRLRLRLSRDCGFTRFRSQGAQQLRLLRATDDAAAGAAAPPRRRRVVRCVLLGRQPKQEPTKQHFFLHAAAVSRTGEVVIRSTSADLWNSRVPKYSRVCEG